MVQFLLCRADRGGGNDLREPVKNYLADFFRQGGGRGVPPNSAKGFGQDDFPLREGGGYSPILLGKVLLDRRYFRYKNSILPSFFYTFLALFGLIYGLLGPFLTLFNTKTSF